MTLDRLRPLATRMLDPWVTAADRVGLTPNGVSVLAFGTAIAAGASFALADAGATTLGAPDLANPLWYAVGAFLVGVNGWLDLLDGALAREQEVTSDGGDLLDHVLDRYADIVIVAGLAAGVGGAEGYALGFAAVTGVVMTSYLGTQSQAVGLDRAYGGLVGRADRLAIIGLVGFASAAVPGAVVAGLGLVGWVLVLLAVVGHLTALQRFWGAWTRL
jgi:archaetidylinositol phosphate synthase